MSSALLQTMALVSSPSDYLEWKEGLDWPLASRPPFSAVSQSGGGKQEPCLKSTGPGKGLSCEPAGFAPRALHGHPYPQLWAAEADGSGDQGVGSYTTHCPRVKQAQRVKARSRLPRLGDLSFSLKPKQARGNHKVVL